MIKQLPNESEKFDYLDIFETINQVQTLEAALELQQTLYSTEECSEFKHKYLSKIITDKINKFHEEIIGKNKYSFAELYKIYNRFGYRYDSNNKLRSYLERTCTKELRDNKNNFRTIVHILDLSSNAHFDEGKAQKRFYALGENYENFKELNIKELESIVHKLGNYNAPDKLEQNKKIHANVIKRFKEIVAEKLLNNVNIFEIIGLYNVHLHLREGNNTELIETLKSLNILIESKVDYLTNNSNDIKHLYLICIYLDGVNYNLKDKTKRYLNTLLKKLIKDGDLEQIYDTARFTNQYIRQEAEFLSSEFLLVYGSNIEKKSYGLNKLLLMQRIIHQLTKRENYLKNDLDQLDNTIEEKIIRKIKIKINKGSISRSQLNFIAHFCIKKGPVYEITTGLLNNTIKI